MDAPLSFLRTSEVGTLLAVTGALTLVCMRWFVPLRTAGARIGIVSLEFAWTRDRAAGILEAWRLQRLVSAARRLVYLDFVLIVLYAAALALLGVMTGRVADVSGLLSNEHADTLGILLAGAGVGAAVLDCGENVFLLRLLKDHVDQPNPAATSVFASLKWLLLAVSFFGSLGFLIASAIEAL
jgi:hypothetical protein